MAIFWAGAIAQNEMVVAAFGVHEQAAREN